MQHGVVINYVEAMHVGVYVVELLLINLIKKTRGTKQDEEVYVTGLQNAEQYETETTMFFVLCDTRSSACRLDQLKIFAEWRLGVFCCFHC